jgi:hypothetical protein
MSARMTVRVLKGVVGALAVAALMVPGAAAKGPGGGGGHGGGGGGGGTGEVAPNSLSVPAVFVGGSNPYGLLCDGVSFSVPTGEPHTGYTLPGYYYVQGVNSWQATCGYAESATVTAEWGDNLGGDARLKVGSPIRVEIGLFDTTPNTYTGWVVQKLEPAQLDRVSPYGTLATATATGYVSNPVTPFGETRVWAAGATLSIVATDTDVPVYVGPATAEINSTGRIVYGYNLRVPAAGDYTITFTFPGVTIQTTDLGDIGPTADTVSFIVTVTGGGGGGGGKGGGGNH